MESMWEHEDQPHWRDYLMAVFFASFFPVARLFLDSIIFEVNCEMLTTFNALKVGHIISKLMEVPIKRSFLSTRRWFLRVLHLSRCWPFQLKTSITVAVTRTCFSHDTSTWLQKSARRLLFSGEKKVTKKRLLEVNEKKVSKFTESAWKLTYYMFTTTTLLLSARNEPWFGKTEHFWIEWPNHAIK